MCGEMEASRPPQHAAKSGAWTSEWAHCDDNDDVSGKGQGRDHCDITGTYPMPVWNKISSCPSVCI